MVLSDSKHEKVNLNKTEQRELKTAPILRPNNGKRIPAMMQEIARKEELIRKATQNRVRGHSEANTKIN